MFVTKKEHEELKKVVEKQDETMREMMVYLSQMAQELEELKKPKEPNYFG